MNTQKKEAAASADTQQRVCFKLGGETYCERSEVIQEILTWVTPTPVPGALYVVSGILNVRGEIITVLNGRKLLNLPDAEPDDNWRVITLDLPEGLFGISVDAVDEMVELQTESIEYLVNTGGDSDISAAMLVGTAQHNDRLLICTDLPGLCQSLTVNNT